MTHRAASNGWISAGPGRELPPGMTEHPLRPTQVALYAAGAGMLAFTPFAALASAQVVAWQLGWAALTTAGAWLLGKTVAQRARRLMCIIAAFIPTLYAPVVVLTGGPSAPTFAWMVAMPLGLILIFRGNREAVVAGAVSAVLAAALVCAALPPPPPIFVLRVVQVAVAAGLAVTGAHAFAVAARRETEAIEAQRLAAEALSQSELRRERAERSLYLMRLARALAHEVNNPLAILMSNIQLLQTDATRPDDVEALNDALHGVERIRDVVDELRSIAEPSRTVTATRRAAPSHRVVVALPRA